MNVIASAPTHYVIVRDDLPRGFLAAQVLHAASESSPQPDSPGTNAVVLAVRSEQELLALSARLSDAHIPHTLIQEPDPPWHGQATAIGLLPVYDRATVKRLLAKLPLLQ